MGDDGEKEVMLVASESGMEAPATQVGDEWTGGTERWISFSASIRAAFSLARSLARVMMASSCSASLVFMSESWHCRDWVCDLAAEVSSARTSFSAEASCRAMDWVL